MLTTGERATAHRMAESVKDDTTAGTTWRLLASALLEAEERECGYQERIRELQDAVERTARSGVENAARYAADLAREKSAGAAAVDRVRVTLLEGASDETQARAIGRAVNVTVGGAGQLGVLYEIASAYLALSASHAEARARLLEIGTRALVLLGKAPT